MANAILNVPRWTLASILLWFFYVSACPAQAPEKQLDDDSTPTEVVSESGRRKITLKQLTELQQTIDAKQSARAELIKLGTNETMSESQLSGAIQVIDEELQSLQQSFEQVALGGIDVSVFISEPESKFDWQQEVLEISKPILDGLKDLTEKPRRIEQTRAKIARIRTQLDTSKRALRSLNALPTDALPKATAERLKNTTKAWQLRARDLERELGLMELSLQRLFDEEGAWWNSLKANARDFTFGRGRILLIAAAAAVAVWLLMKLVRTLVESRLVRRSRRPWGRRYRVLLYAFRLITGVLMILAVLLTFSALGDFLLLTLSMVLLITVVLTLRQYLPRYFAEARLLLDIGPVREGERLIYAGLPWEVKTVNVYSVIRNPALEGVIRLPLNTLSELTSRPCGEEPWFPSTKGDYLLLPDNTFSQVLRQTPDVVQISVFGGTQVIFPTTQFFALGAKNLSRPESFVVPVIFGIDYQHQAICLDTVPTILQTQLEKELSSFPFGQYILSVKVDFKEAATSSLDYLIIVRMASEGAAFYMLATRAIQQVCVRTCNQEQWVIPFAQLTVHHAEQSTD